MKKLFLGLLGVLMMLLSYGQDTITESYPGYIFYPHSLPLATDGNNNFSPIVIAPRNGSIWENIVSHDTLIYGVSLRGVIPLDSTYSVSLAYKEGEEFIYVDTAYFDSNVRCCFFKYEAHPRASSLVVENVEKCNEAYFHRPWPVSDTFYVFIHSGGSTVEGFYLHTVLLETILPQRRGQWLDNGEFTGLYPNNLTSFGWVGTEHLWGVEFPILHFDPRKCPKPTWVYITGRGAGWVSLAWNSGAGDGYQVTVEGPDDTIVTTTTDTTILLNNLVTEGIYWVRVRSLCRYQYYGYDSTFVNPGSASIGIRVSGDGVSELDADPQIGLYPNPANKVVNLSVTEPGEVCIVDVTGRTVLKRQVRPGSSTIDVGTLPDGLYIVKTGTYHSSLIIHH